MTLYQIRVLLAPESELGTGTFRVSGDQADVVSQEIRARRGTG